MIEDLIPNDPTHFEALFAGHGVDNHVTVYSNEMLAVEYGILILASSINDLDSEVLILVPNNFAEGVFDCWIVGVDKVAVDVLYCKRALACYTLSQLVAELCVV